jgi:hypothetical protein
VAVDGDGVIGKAALDRGPGGFVALGLGVEGAGQEFPAVGDLHVIG